MRRIACLALPLLLAPAAAFAWGDDGHKLVLREAIRTLPPDVRRVYERKTRELDRLVVEPDHRSQVPAEGCKHWINIEKTAPDYLAQLDAALHREYGTEGWADEDARGVAAALDDRVFRADPPPWTAARVDPLWSALPPTLDAFRAAHGRLDVFIGTVVYQPLLYTRALARALARGDTRRALAYAGYLAHYTADLHVPVHVTANYRGQYSSHLLFEDRERGDPHCRFETGYLKADLARIVEAVKARRNRPVVLAPDRITPLVIEAARHAYDLAPRLLEIDRTAVARADPRRDWEGWLAAVTPAYRDLASAQLAAAADLLSSLLLTAAGTGLLEVAPASAKMGPSR